MQFEGAIRRCSCWCYVMYNCKIMLRNFQIGVASVNLSWLVFGILSFGLGIPQGWLEIFKPSIFNLQLLEKVYLSLCLPCLWIVVINCDRCWTTGCCLLRVINIKESLGCEKTGCQYWRWFWTCRLISVLAAAMELYIVEYARRPRVSLHVKPAL